MAKSTTKKKKAETVQWWWQLRVELLEVAPRVWRRLVVPEDIKLPALHRVLQASLGWTDSHLHQFNIAGRKYAASNPDWEDELGQLDERRIVLQKALGHESRCFDYLYDFGDSWHHVVLVEDHHPSLPDHPMAIRCIDGENACPPEDVGGAHGYAQFLAALADPRHEEHEQYLTWIGGRFDPSRFDLTAINHILGSLKV
jgi:hypothetical protein